MKSFRVGVYLVVKAENAEAANAIASGAADHLSETFNDDDSVEWVETLDDAEEEIKAW